MPAPLVLASASTTRIAMLRAAGLSFDVRPARIDEPAIRDALLAEGASPRDIADVLAEAKARKVSGQGADGLVLGCDQVLAFEGGVLGKPDCIDAAKAHLRALRGRRHQLLSAAVLYQNGSPVWRHVAEVSLTMRQFSEAFLDAYVERNRDWLCDTVGGYRIEAEGVRLFSRIDGDWFAILGLPLLPLLSYLADRGVIEA
jgi:septum formation protein